MATIKDKKKDEIIVQKLEELGLTVKEAQVYIALLAKPDTGTSALIKMTRLHGQFIYQSLGRLEELGLAKHVIQSGRKRFSANPPQCLILLVNEKKVAAELVVRELTSRFSTTPDQAFEVYQGQSSFVASQLEMLKSVPDGGVIHILGGGGKKYIELMGHEIEGYDILRIKKKVQIRYLCTGGQSLHLQIMAQTRKLFDYRVLPLPACDVAMDIVPDQISMHLFGDPVVSFSFTNKAISDGYRKFFEVLWSISTK